MITSETFEEIQSNINDLMVDIDNIRKDIDCATGCETVADCKSNIEEALEKAATLTQDLKHRLKQLSK